MDNFRFPDCPVVKYARDIICITGYISENKFKKWCDEITGSKLYEIY